MSISVTYLLVLGLASLLCDFDGLSSEQDSNFEAVTVSGIYTGGFEVRSFRPCDSTESWWLADRIVNERYAERSTRNPDTYWQIQIRALVSPLGKYGHLGGYERCVTRVELISAVESQSNECGK